MIHWHRVRGLTLPPCDANHFSSWSFVLYEVLEKSCRGIFVSIRRLEEDSWMDLMCGEVLQTVILSFISQLCVAFLFLAPNVRCSPILYAPATTARSLGHCALQCACQAAVERQTFTCSVPTKERELPPSSRAHLMALVWCTTEAGAVADFTADTNLDEAGRGARSMRSHAGRTQRSLQRPPLPTHSHFDSR